MNLRWCFFACLFLLVGLKVELANAQIYRKVGKKILPYTKIVVDQSGHGNFSTIQSAIDSIPSNNRHWVNIKVNEGTYREKVKIPLDKPYIILKGDGKRSTLVDWDDHTATDQSPTFSILADNIVIKSMSFRNSYNNPMNSNPVTPAVAAMVTGDKCYFFRVGFFGMQDTLWDESGRHYYKLCTIQGAIDFIFGRGQALFESCAIYVIDGALGPGWPGYITAQGRSSPKDSNGFVFKDCKVFGTGSIYLGRAWGDYSRVLFYNTYMSSIVQPSGWDAWYSAGHEDRITFAEYDNFGPGAKTSKRVNWTTKLGLSTVKELASLKFIDTEGWVDRLRIIGRPGYITAHGRNNPNDATGFVFKDCKVFGNGKTYLGRPWRDYARVLFYNTYMSNIIKPTGWEPWHSVGQE
ncbi:probable pectinesterase 29 [Gastrolobium bilobum]|uniref:probable pectinesterase 29 n=1 Tax=Gastrolobium bilobum TaxID=150636 RepID=UPI002AAF565B|nr:probable pectinesterase 29 [Gastrolobium bilobum]